MSLGPAYVMLAVAEATEDGAGASGLSLQYVTIFVADIALHFQVAVREGAAIVEDLHETVYGERQYAATDQEGYRWIFSQHMRDLEPEDWGGRSAH